MAKSALISLALAHLDGEALLDRLASLAARGRRRVTFATVQDFLCGLQVVPYTDLDELVQEIRDRARWQQHVHAARPRALRPRRRTKAQRIESILSGVLGPPERWLVAGTIEARYVDHRLRPLVAVAHAEPKPIQQACSALVGRLVGQPPRAARVSSLIVSVEDAMRDLEEADLERLLGREAEHLQRRPA